MWKYLLVRFFYVQIESVPWIIVIVILFYIGFRGNARVILPGLTACMDCTLDLYPPQVSLLDII